MRYCSDKEVDRLIRRLVSQGWLYRNGSKHGRLAHPAGSPVLTVSRTPSDWRSVRNFFRDLRNASSASELP